MSGRRPGVGFTRSATRHAIQIRLTDEVLEGAPEVSLTVGRSPDGSTAWAVDITFADGDGGGGGSLMFDLPYIERWFHHSTGRLWTFGLVPRDSQAVSIGDVTGRVVNHDYLTFAVFLMDADPDAGGSILFRLQSGEGIVRLLMPVAAEDLNWPH